MQYYYAFTALATNIFLSDKILLNFTFKYITTINQKTSGNICYYVTKDHVAYFDKKSV